MESMERIAQAERMIGYTFKDREMLAKAFMHSSATDDRHDSNERMEFLGDAVLGMVVCEALFERFPDMLEGELTKIKSNVVSRRTCCELTQELELESLLVLGKGMGGRGEIPPSLQAAVLESVIGAMYLDGGLEVARDFILRLLNPRIEEAARLGHQHNFKSVLQQVFQRKGLGSPSYSVIDEQGPDHAKCFEVCVESNTQRFDGCWGANKKQAEQKAALAALTSLKLAFLDEDGDIKLSPECWTNSSIEDFDDSASQIENS